MNLARGAVGQLGAEREGHGHLEPGEVLAAKDRQLARVGRGTLLEHDEGLGRLAAGVVGHGEHRGLEDGRVLLKHALDLVGRDVLAGRDDEVLLAPRDPQVAVGVDAGHVARAEPAVGGERLGGLVGSVVVAGGHAVAAHP